MNPVLADKPRSTFSLLYRRAYSLRGVITRAKLGRNLPIRNRRSADWKSDWQSAVSPVGNMRAGGRSADCQSATQQTDCLRYDGHSHLRPSAVSTPTF